MSKRKRIQTFIRRSCLTGKIIWVYHGITKTAERLAYFRACKREMNRVRGWKERLDKRRRNLKRLLSDSSSGIPITDELTPEQRCAAQHLNDIGRQSSSQHSEFYEHIVEEKKRRDEDLQFRSKCCAEKKVCN